MECIKCEFKMEGIDVNDNPNEGYAYNIYHCVDCMIICKQDVWENAGELWIDKENNIVKRIW